MPTVLVADDEPHMRKLIELSLKKANLDTVLVENGELALAQTRELRPDAVVLDVTMPVMDGMQTLRELKAAADTRMIPVVMLTSKGLELTRNQAEESGADAFITKPFSPRMLADEILRLIADRNA